jgi:glycerate kinase
MNILIAPNSMKGSLDAFMFASTVAKGFRSVSPAFNLREVPVADGGDFTGKVLAYALGAREYTTAVSGPSGRKTEAIFAISGRTAIIEMAEASGLRLIEKNEKDPMKNNTFGTGELILAAMERGCNHILLGLGGSATIEGGIGMLEALGFEFYANRGERLPATARSLHRISEIRLPDSLRKDIRITILSDVNNPLLGPNGAVAVFGPQKGTDAEMAVEIEAGLENWIRLLEQKSGKTLRNIPGMGAAGGMASGLVAFLDASMVPGADTIFSILRMDENIGWADRIITGEGKIDSQSLGMKAPEVLARKAKAAGKPVIAIAGMVHPEATANYDSVYSLTNRDILPAEAIIRAEELVFSVSVCIAALWLEQFQELKTQHSRLTEAEKLIENGNFTEAATLLYIPEMEKLAGCHYLRGRIGMKRQEWGSALNEFRRCLELDPEHPKADTERDIVNAILDYRYTGRMNP